MKKWKIGLRAYLITFAKHSGCAQSLATWTLICTQGEKHLAEKTNVVYTDAALHRWNRNTKEHRVVSVVVNHQGDLVTSISQSGCRVSEGEEAAVALAVAEGYRRNKSLTIITDSKEACRHYTNGRISKGALRIILQAGPPNKEIQHKIFWVPGHTGVTGNQRADDLARELTNRADTSSDPEPTTTVEPSYAEILNHYRGQRIAYPPPHQLLKQYEAVGWRRLQTGSFHNLHILHKMFPNQYADTCKWCGATPTLYHITWECKNNYSFHKLKEPNAEQWESLLTSSVLAVQKGLVQHAYEVARLSGALE